MIGKDYILVVMMTLFESTGSNLMKVESYKIAGFDMTKAQCQVLYNDLQALDTSAASLITAGYCIKSQNIDQLEIIKEYQEWQDRIDDKIMLNDRHRDGRDEI